MACEAVVRYPHLLGDQSPSLNRGLLPEMSLPSPRSTINFTSPLGAYPKSSNPLLKGSSSHWELKTNHGGLSRTSNTPPQGPLETTGSLQYMNNEGGSTPISIKLEATIDKGFFYSDGEWTCYRRNYFSCVCSFTLSPVNLASRIVYYTPDGSHEALEVQKFSIRISAHVDGSEPREVEVVQHRPKRDKGAPPSPPGKVLLAPRQGDHSDRWPYPGQHIFERIQFRIATANNGKRKATQQYFRFVTQLFAEVGTQSIKIAQIKSAKLVVRGRSPGHYKTERYPSSDETIHSGYSLTAEDHGGMSMFGAQSLINGARSNSIYKVSDTEDMEDTPLSPSSQLIINAVMQSLCKWLDEKVAAIQQTTGNSDHATGSSTSTAIATNSGDTTGSEDGHESRHHQSRSNLRRQRRDSEDDENQDERDRKKTRENHGHTRGGDEAKRFACPYFKRNPRKYCKEQTCVGPGWTEIHRVK